MNLEVIYSKIGGKSEELITGSYSGPHPLPIPQILMEAAPPPPLPSPIFGGDLKISDRNSWGGPEQKTKFVGGAKFKGRPKILGGVYKPH